MAIIMTLFLRSSSEIILIIAQRAKEQRLGLNLSQKSLSLRSGVSLSVIKKFERTGKISLESLLKLAIILDVIQDFDALFHPKTDIPSIDFLIKKASRKRGRE